MAIYAALADIINTISKKRVVDVSDDDKDSQIDEVVVTNALDMAESEVNAALSKGGYIVPAATPLPVGAEILKTITIWLGICMLHARRGEVPIEYLESCRFYREYLNQIAEGAIALPLPGSSTSTPKANTEGQEQVFTRSKFEIGTGEVRNPDENHSLDTV